jgi:hypothetical protein
MLALLFGPYEWRYTHTGGTPYVLLDKPSRLAPVTPAAERGFESILRKRSGSFGDKRAIS